MPLLTFLFGELVNAFGVSSPDNVVPEISKVVLQFLYVAVGAGVASLLQVSSWIANAERQAARIRALYLKSLIRQDIVYFDKETNTGQVIERLSGDTILIQDAMGEKVGKFIHLVSMFFGGFILAIIIGWQLALVLMACIPFIAMSAAFMSLMMLKLSAQEQLKYAEAGSIVEETVGSIRTVASFSGESQAIETYNNIIRKAYKSVVHHGVAAGLGNGSVMMITYCSYGLAIWYGSSLVIKKSYNGGEVINVMLAIMTGAMSLGEASPCVSAFAAGQAAAYKMFEVIHRKPVIDAYEMTGMVSEDMKGDVELRDVYFSYPARPDHLIFNGFSLHVRSGTTMALVGESGSGKSTVISLVERFYDPQAGEVLIDGFNLKDLRLSWIREKIGLISQEPILFTTTIKDNIAFGKDGARDEEIRSAIEVANAVKFIDKIPHGLETMVGEHGIQLSGGQKQRIAIARAILKNPKILLLDEATSALDAESERLVHDALLKIMVDKTIIIIAHRLSNVKNADTISVMQGGKVVEQGSHSELFENSGGVYSQLLRLQDITNIGVVAVPSNGMTEISPSNDVSKYSRGSENHDNFQKRSHSHGPSLGGHSHSFGLSFGSTSQVEPNRDDLEEKDEVEKQEHADYKERKQVSILRLIYLNKPEIPALLAGSIAAAINGVIFPVFGILMSSVIKIYYEPLHQLQKDAIFWALMYVLLGLIGGI